MSGVLNFDAASYDVPVEFSSKNPLRGGGTKTMFHAGYGLPEVKECGRWTPSCFYSYLRYDMHAMRGAGGDMAVATGRFQYAKLKQSRAKTATFRIGGKRKVRHSTSGIFPDARNIPS